MVGSYICNITGCAFRAWGHRPVARLEESQYGIEPLLMPTPPELIPTYSTRLQLAAQAIIHSVLLIDGCCVVSVLSVTLRILFSFDIDIVP